MGDLSGRAAEKVRLIQDEERKTELRKELKAWERLFEKTKGRKPSAVDVKADREINAKYKLYHKLFRAKSTQVNNEIQTKISYISPTTALRQITPRKKSVTTELITPLKGSRVFEDQESVGPTPQVNGRLLGLFDQILDSTPRVNRMFPHKLNYSRNPATEKATPRKRSLSELLDLEDQ